MKILGIVFAIWVCFSGCSNGRARDIGGAHFSVDEDNSNDVKIDRTPVADEKFAPANLVRWVEDVSHGLRRVRTLDNFKYMAQYKPCSYIICEEQRKESIPDSIVQKRLKDLDGMQYIDLKIELKEGKDELLKYGLISRKEYEDRINYFSFGMQKDIQLVEAGDTLSCLLFHFERVYNVCPSATFLLAFPLGKDPKADKTLLFFDHGFNKGIIKFFFDGRDIKNIPQLEAQ